MGDINNKNIVQQQELAMLKEIDRISRQDNLVYYLGYGTALGAIRHKGFIPWDTDIDIIVNIDSYKKFCDAINTKIDSKYELKSFHTDSIYNSLKARVSLKGQTHKTIHIDIFPMVGSPKTNIGKKLFSKVSYWNYRCYTNKKTDFKTIEKRTPKASIVKFLLSPVPTSAFINIFNKLSTMFPIEQSSTLYNICGSYGHKEFISKEWLGEPIYADFEDYKFPVPKEWDKYLTHIYGDYMTPKKTNYV